MLASELIQHNPTLLTTYVQKTGLAGTILDALIVRDVPPNRDILASLPVRRFLYHLFCREIELNVCLCRTRSARCA